jgi:transcription elongation GreA/GreB family factor
MNKRALIRKIVARLTDELEVYFRAAQASRAEATHEQSKAENKYDTRGLEASYLARGQSKQAAEIQNAIAAFEKLDARKFGPGEPIDVGAFVELALDGEKTAYFIGPRAGGTEVLHEKREVLVITPQSPLGEQLLGRKQGDVLKLKLADVQNQYRVTAVVGARHSTVAADVSPRHLVPCYVEFAPTDVGGYENLIDGAAEDVEHLFAGVRIHRLFVFGVGVFHEFGRKLLQKS